MRARLGRLLRRWADRLDPQHAAKPFTWSFTYERSGARGAVTEKHTDGRGCPLWMYVGDEPRAFDEADSDWRSPEQKLADMIKQFGENVNDAMRPAAEAFSKIPKTIREEDR